MTKKEDAFNEIVDAYADRLHQSIARQIGEGDDENTGNRECPKCGGVLVAQPNDDNSTSILRCASCAKTDEYIKPFSGSGPQTADDVRRMNRWRGLRW